MAGSDVSAADPAISGGENEIKAAFLVNLPKYVDWPSGNSAAPAAPLVLAIFGTSDLEGELRKAIEGKAINGRPLALKRVGSEEECANGCHIVFVGAAEQRRVPGLLHRLRDLSVLTVGESDGFLENGGIIKLVRRERKIRLEVNLAAARQARLEISSKLLKVADTILGKTP